MDTTELGPDRTTGIGFEVVLIYAHEGIHDEGHVTFAGPSPDSDDYTIDMPYSKWVEMGRPTVLHFSLMEPNP